MKKKRIAAFVCGAACAFTACTFASCGQESTASSPFNFTEIGEVATYTDYTYTHGYEAEEISSVKGAVYYYAQISVQSDEAVTISAGDFVAFADGEEYVGEGFVSFLKTEEKTEEGENSYVETVASSVKELLAEKAVDGGRSSSTVNLLFGFEAVPSSLAVYYRGVLLNEVEGGGTRMAAEKYDVGGIYAGIISDGSDSSEGGNITSFETGEKVYRYTYVNETKVNASYSTLSLKATVGTENVTVDADKFTLDVGEKSYSCNGFVSTSSTVERDGEVYYVENNVTLSDTYTVTSSEVADMRLVFAYSFPSGEEYVLRYGDAELSR